ncbi:GNAT family N-acetyltransferase [Streptomyces sp. CBMA152]|uniref:GNAT family N-acetyltransferase n=1 Tax=Streptomyces sp. CBMA152 TaxID=1896312 RepID=UPI0016609C1B|nr:GNAT family N-acetyltransferase [Streptomyces sp. CBMA152]MBD0740732.1 GNAT family N-acetyltransferase [Streptomyces sp. CBMA152]
MTTTIRPTGPLQQGADGATSRTYDVCVNSRRVGTITVATHAGFGAAVGVIRGLSIDERDRGRGRGTVAALAAEEVLRGWGCGQVFASVPAGATAALRLSTALGYIDRGRNMAKRLPAEPPALPPGVSARPMTEAEYTVWHHDEQENYVRGWIARGMAPDRARAKAEADHRANLPDGLATPGTHLQVLVSDEAVVGHIWLAHRELDTGPGAYVYDVAVAEEHRGRGHGRALMLLAERLTVTDGLPVLALHVFADNTTALRLYESLGYETTEYNRGKTLV